MLLGQRFQDFGWLALPNEQGSAHVFKVGLQIREGLQQKLRSERTGLDLSPTVFRPLGRVQDEHRNDFRGGLDRGVQRGVVGDPQVVSEPVEGA